MAILGWLDVSELSFTALLLHGGHGFGEYFEMQRVVPGEGSILLHPGTNTVNDDDAH